MVRVVRPVYPQCQCKERQEAMKRMAAAIARGDYAAAAIEKDFVTKSLAEDAAAVKEYAKLAAEYYSPSSILNRKK